MAPAVQAMYFMHTPMIPTHSFADVTGAGFSRARLCYMRYVLHLKPLLYGRDKSVRDQNICHQLPFNVDHRAALTSQRRVCYRSQTSVSSRSSRDPHLDQDVACQCAVCDEHDKAEDQPHMAFHHVDSWPHCPIAAERCARFAPILSPSKRIWNPRATLSLVLLISFVHRRASLVTVNQVTSVTRSTSVPLTTLKRACCVLQLLLRGCNKLISSTYQIGWSTFACWCKLDTHPRPVISYDLQPAQHSQVAVTPKRSSAACFTDTCELYSPAVLLVDFCTPTPVWAAFSAHRSKPQVASRTESHFLQATSTQTQFST